MPTRTLTASDRKVLRDEIKQYLTTYPIFTYRSLSTDNNSLVYENIFPKQEPFVSLGTTIRNKYIWTYIRTTQAHEEFFAELEIHLASLEQATGVQLQVRRAQRQRYIVDYIDDYSEDNLPLERIASVLKGYRDYLKSNVSAQMVW